MIFIMAWRNIWRNKMRSIVIMLSVAIGLFAGIAVLALYKGMMESRVRTVIDAETAHLQIHHPRFKEDYDPSYILSGGDSLMMHLKSMQQVRLVAPRSIVQGMLATTTGSAGVQVNGVIPSMEYDISRLKKKIIEGEGFHKDKKNEIVIGKKLAGKMKLALGSKLVLTFTDTSGGIVSAAFRISAIYQSENTPLDELNVYVEMNELNDLLLIDESYHELAVLLHRDGDVDLMQQQLIQKFPGYTIETWKEISPETDLLVKTVDQYSYIIMVIILFALTFGIINTMLMAILERTREIGMMVALGTKRVKVFLLVLMETVFLTIAGTPLGILAGLLVTNYFHKNGLDLSGLGQEMMSRFGFSTTIYPAFPAEKLPVVILLVIGAAIISCFFPAYRALRLQPVEALRR